MTHSGESWRLGHRPALDGLRGIAVLLVIVCHVFPHHYLIGGTAGVAAFFTLSGFLITSILLDRQDGIRKFYVRRARRLLPALAAFLVAMVVLGVTTPATVVPPALYVQNYVVIHDRGEGPIVHLWSLSVEEQFYLLWPFLLLWLTRRMPLRWVLALTLALAELSVLLRLYLLVSGGFWARIYCASDTNACLLLFGCATALALKTGAIRPLRPSVGVAAIVGIALIGFAPDMKTEFAVVPIAAAALAVVAILGLLDARAMPRPLTLVGQRSYALYLWHYPLVTVLAARLPVAHWLALVLMLGASWGATVLSWRFVEQPLRKRRFGSRDAGDATQELVRGNVLDA